MPFAGSQEQEVKKVNEIGFVVFDFISALAAGETISTKVVTASVYSGTDASPSSIISGSATSGGAIVSQKVTGGVAGTLYELLCTITTSLGQTLTMSSFLAVIPNTV